MSEALRQQALLACLASRDLAATLGLPLRETGQRAERGLAAYRANGSALAERVLVAAFPMLQAMLGEEDFAQLARALWREHPPERGDMGEWGDALPAWIEAQPDLAEWPWLADGARLELARHRCERAADAAFDAASLNLLAELDPAQIALDLMPGTQVLISRWPLATIAAAHGLRVEGDALGDFDAVRTAVAQGRGEAVLVVRQGWRSHMHRIDAHAAQWMLDLLTGLSLAQALERALEHSVEHSGDAFDFGTWLQQAIAAGWLKGARRCAD
jgi:hypothetical protein